MIFPAEHDGVERFFATAPNGHHIALLYTFTTAERTARLADDPDAANLYADELVFAAERALPAA